MHSFVVDIADSAFDCPVNSSFINGWQQFVKAAFDRRCVIVKLKQVGSLPIDNFISP